MWPCEYRAGHEPGETWVQAPLLPSRPLEKFFFHLHLGVHFMPHNKASEIVGREKLSFTIVFYGAKISLSLDELGE